MVQFGTKKTIEKPFEILLDEIAIRNDNTYFTDKNVHKVLEKLGCYKFKNSEWFECTINEVKEAIFAVKSHNSDISKRKEIQEKLLKFATRIPVFMYLTDDREQILEDVITQLEPELLKKVTGLTIPDFELLVRIGIFNEQLMNSAVFAFKRYEDASLFYTGLSKHTELVIDGWNTKINR